MKKVTHIAGTFIVQADAAFLNGTETPKWGEDKNVAIPKTFWDGKRQMPYVSSQSWKRWLRTTMREEEPNWPGSEPQAIGWNIKGNVNQISGRRNPVDVPEDDIFGYMKPEEGQGKAIVEDNKEDESDEIDTSPRKRTKSLIRAAPFMASVLFPISSKVTVSKDVGFVHLTKYDPKALAEAEVERFLITVEKNSDNGDIWGALERTNKELYKKANEHSEKNELTELRKLLSENAGGKEIKFIENPCSPLPYSTKFYSSSLQGVFCLNYSRLGLYWNVGDRIELEETKVKEFLKEKKIEEVTKTEDYKVFTDDGKVGRVFKISDTIHPTPKERASALLKSLSVLRGGAKQAQFGTDVSPKAIILAGLTCGNPIFNHLFIDSLEGPELRTATLKEVVKDYADRIVTPVIIGIRTGYLKAENEDEVKKLDKAKIVIGEGGNKKEIEFLVMTPLEAAKKIAELLP